MKMEAVSLLIGQNEWKEIIFQLSNALIKEKKSRSALSFESYIVCSIAICSSTPEVGRCIHNKQYFTENL